MDLDTLPDNPFVRLRALIGETTPGEPALNMSIGEPQHAFPPMAMEALNEASAGFGKYPPTEGPPEFLASIGNWLERRYGITHPTFDAHGQVLPVSGTREALFLAAQLAPKKENAAVLMPNPFYQCYGAAALSIRAEPVYLPTSQETNFLPDFRHLPEDLLARTVAVYFCSPANPQGTCASRADWQGLMDLAREYNFLVLADECYAEIYDKTPPTGVLEVADGNFDRVLAFHSLSKRSSLPGLRSGFVAGDAKLIARFKKLRLYGGAPMPLPVAHASAAVWGDEAHVEENRTLYREKIDIAAEIFGNRFGFYRPPGGFFLWLDVSETGKSDEEIALGLWREKGVRVLPGSYLSRAEGGIDPGKNFLRIALVATADETRKALTRINQFLS